MNEPTFPLLHKVDAERGVPGSAILYLRELAHSLRNSPSTEVCAAAAELLERASRGGPDGAAKALYLRTHHRPPESDRDNEIRDLAFYLLEQGLTLTSARKQLAERYSLSFSRVKALTQDIPYPIQRIDASWVDS